MPGLFGTLYLGQQSLQVQRQGVEVSGHNLANVNNPAYARQRLQIQTSPSIRTVFGSQGTGAEVAGIRQLRNGLIDSQLQGEFSVRGFLEAAQSALQSGQSILGQTIDSQATGADAASASGAAGGQHGIAERLGALFNSFQNVATSPTSLAERQALLRDAQDLASQFNQIDKKLGQLNNSLGASIQTDVDAANDLINQIASLNKEIFNAEGGAPGSANDLRDLRQQRIEDLSKLVNIQTTEQPNGMVNLSISGAAIVTGVTATDTLQTYDPGNGNILVRTTTGATPLTLTGGSVQGTIDARDGALKSMRDGLNTLASSLISQVNALHAAGFSLTGATGANFFTGTNAGDIGVNAALVTDPALVQAAGVNGATSDNQVALALAQLARQKLPALGNQTFAEDYSQVATGIGQSLFSVNNSLGDQDVVEAMLLRQRDSISGVSLDEEMTELVKYQKAFEASAHLITTVTEMIDTVINMKR
ncbi:MAG: flagellar hook-associated protein 1 [Verrucomicrobiota bacterium]|jgi:flagellar hook-associated protein 1 FlgK